MVNYKNLIGVLYEYDCNKYWLGVELYSKDAYGIVSDEKYHHDYPSNINRLHMYANNLNLYKPKQLIPFSNLKVTNIITTNIFEALNYKSKIKRECDRYDTLVRGFDGAPFPGAVYKLQDRHVVIILNVKKNKRYGGWVYGYLFSTAYNGFIGKRFKAPYREFDLSELKLFTESGQIQPKFKGCLSIEGFNKYNLDFKNKINNVWLDIRMIISEHLDLSKIDEEESSNGNQ